VRWGLLGAAAITDRRLAPAFREAGHELAVVGARSLERARDFADRHGVGRAVEGYEEVLAADVDAVYVALPNDLHERWSVAALQAGRHVLCEKPLALDASGAQRVADASAAAGRVVMEAIMTRHAPRTIALLDLVHGGGVGRLVSTSATFAFDMVRPANYRSEAGRGGGALLDVGIYGVSMARWLHAEEPDSVEAVARWWPGGVDGTTVALLGFPAGGIATVTASFDSARAQSLEIIGTAGVLSVPRPFTAGAEHGEEAVLLRDGEEVGRWRANPYVEMARAFAAAVESGAVVAPLPVADSVGSAAVLDRISAASRPGAATPGAPTPPAR
jgi:predicted dehydrogenase